MQIVQIGVCVCVQYRPKRKKRNIKLGQTENRDQNQIKPGQTTTREKKFITKSISVPRIFIEKKLKLKC